MSAFFFFIFHISGNSFYMWRTTVKKWDLWNSFLMDTLQKLYILIICVQEIFFKGTCRTYHSFLLNFRGISKTYSLRVFFPLLYTSNINLLMHSNDLLAKSLRQILKESFQGSCFPWTTCYFQTNVIYSPCCFKHVVFAALGHPLFYGFVTFPGP